MSLSPLTRLSTTLANRLSRPQRFTPIDQRPPTPGPNHHPHNDTPYWPTRAEIEREAGYVLEYDDRDRHVWIEYHEVVSCSRPASLMLTRQSGPGGPQEEKTGESSSRRLPSLRTAYAAAKAWLGRSSSAVKRTLRPRRASCAPVFDEWRALEEGSAAGYEGPVTSPAVEEEVEDPRVRMQFREVAWGRGAAAEDGSEEEGLVDQGAPEVVEGRLSRREWRGRSRLPDLETAG